jgi:hypothetical protein
MGHQPFLKFTFIGTALVAMLGWLWLLSKVALGIAGWLWLL